MEQLKNLYAQWRGRAPLSVERLTAAGSNRAYYRMGDGETPSVIGCVGTSVEENSAFLSLARHFERQGLPVPTILAVSADGLRYLQTDLGNRSLFDALRRGREAGGRYDDHERQLLRQAMTLLAQVQTRGAEGLDFSVCYPQAAFDRRGVMFDLNYFKYSFLKATGIDFNEVSLEDDFERLCHDLCREESRTFMYRDFQARNLMLDDEERLWLIDFQGGRRGPACYDVVSMLWQASARYPDALRREMTGVYYDAMSRLTAMPSREDFERELRLFVLFRTMQVLGAYGFRGYFERKPHFLQSIPPAMTNLRETLRSGVARPYPYLNELLGRLTRMQPFAAMGEMPQPVADRPALEVKVWSFSYKRGIPDDESGNGGGYVFDCRSTHNPGRYDEYKQLTGLDEPVIRFLENDGEITRFLDSVYRLADSHVERYIERGFTSLMFSFGCTGGQHRSVYCAQHLAEHLHAKYGVRVHLRHREQGRDEVIV